MCWGPHHLPDLTTHCSPGHSLLTPQGLCCAIPHLDHLPSDTHRAPSLSSSGLYPYISWKPAFTILQPTHPQVHHSLAPVPIGGFSIILITIWPTLYFSEHFIEKSLIYKKCPSQLCSPAFSRVPRLGSRNRAIPSCCSQPLPPEGLAWWPLGLVWTWYKWNCITCTLSVQLLGLIRGMWVMCFVHFISCLLCHYMNISWISLCFFPYCWQMFGLFSAAYINLTGYCQTVVWSGS